VGGGGRRGTWRSGVTVTCRRRGLVDSAGKKTTSLALLTSTLLMGTFEAETVAAEFLTGKHVKQASTYGGVG